MRHDMLQRYIAFFEQLSPQSLVRCEELFSADARFVDPFNDVRGPAAIRAVFSHMFETCEDPQFRVLDSCAAAQSCYLRWEFRFGGTARRRLVSGVSHVCFDEQGRAVEHIDYWDPARQLYEQIPLLGALLRRLRRRLRAPAADSGDPRRNPSPREEELQ